MAASIINLNEYARTGNLIISDNAEPTVWDAAFVNSYVRFVDCLKNNLGLNDEMETIKEQECTEKSGLFSYRVYNYIADDAGWHITDVGLRTAGHIR